MALGSPMGYSDSMAFGMLTSVSNEVSAWDSDYTLLTTDIVGTKEGSGVLLNLDGEIIGVILQSYSGGSNMVTCVGVSEIAGLMETLSNNKDRPYIGIRGQAVTEEIADKTGIPVGILRKRGSGGFSCHAGRMYEWRCDHRDGRKDGEKHRGILPYAPGMQTGGNGESDRHAKGRGRLHRDSI